MENSTVLGGWKSSGIFSTDPAAPPGSCTPCCYLFILMQCILSQNIRGSFKGEPFIRVLLFGTMRQTIFTTIFTCNVSALATTKVFWVQFCADFFVENNGGLWSPTASLFAPQQRSQSCGISLILLSIKIQFVQVFCSGRWCRRLPIRRIDFLWTWRHQWRGDKGASHLLLKPLRVFKAKGTNDLKCRLTCSVDNYVGSTNLKCDKPSEVRSFKRFSYMYPLSLLISGSEVKSRRNINSEYRFGGFALTITKQISGNSWSAPLSCHLHLTFDLQKYAIFLLCHCRTDLVADFHQLLELRHSGVILRKGTDECNRFFVRVICLGQRSYHSFVRRQQP